jgi:hypothetical protein
MMRIARLLIAFAAAAAIVVPGTAAEASPGVAHWKHTVGTAWWVDPDSGRTVVSLDASVSSATVAGLVRSVTLAGGSVIREPGVLRKHIAGADPFYGASSGRCLIGFNARQLPDYYFLTAAHCVGPVGQNVFFDAARTILLGTVATKNVSADYALVRYTNPTISKPSSVNLYNGSFAPIRGFGTPIIGQAVTRSGPSGVRSGRVTALNVTVNFPGGTISGLIRTSVCSQPGDSGGPLFAGTAGIGMTSGGSGSCSTGGITYFSSASRAASAYGVSAY